MHTKIRADRLINREAASISHSKSPKDLRVAYFSFCHPEINPGGAQAIAKRLFDEHERHSGKGSALFIAASIGGGPQRSAGTNLIQVGEHEFVYVCPDFDYIYFTNHDALGQRELVELLRSFSPDSLHFHHFMGFGVDFLQAVLANIRARSVFTVHEHMLVCHNDGHLVQNKNNRICTTTHSARCATCMPEYRYDYFQHRLQHLESVMNEFDHITAVSKFTAAVIQSSMPLKAPICVIPNGPIAASHDSRTDRDSNKLNIAYIGQVHRTKGVHLLMEAVEQLALQDPSVIPRICLDIWGPVVHPQYQEVLNGLVQRLDKIGIPAAFRGIYDSTNLKNVLAGSNIVIVPSMWPESYCLTADEAISLGKTLICADFPAARERFSEGDSVIFVPPGAADGITRALRKLSKQEASRSGASLKFSFNGFGEIYERYAGLYQ